MRKDLAREKTLLTITPVKLRAAKVDLGFFMLARHRGYLLVEVDMLQSYVVRSGHNFKVITAKRTPTGFVDPIVTDKFGTLEEANRKADLCNYVFTEGQKYCQKRQVLQ